MASPTMPATLSLSNTVARAQTPMVAAISEMIASTPRIAAIVPRTRNRRGRSAGGCLGERGRG